MLSDFFKSTWRAYKDDTNSFAAWLARTAEQCGYSSDLLNRTGPSSSLSSSSNSKPSARLKGKARKQAKDAIIAQDKQSKTANVADDSPAKASYIIEVKEFTVLAEYIAGSGKPVVMSRSLVNILNRVIDLRSRHHSWFREQREFDDCTKKVKADESHSYFLGILERTREILKPLMPSDMVYDLLGNPLSVTEDPEEKITTKIRNTFDSLSIQEPSQEFLDAPDVKLTPLSQSSAEHRYEAEMVHTLEEQYLATHCLFQDLRYIRSFLRQLWTSYREGGVELVAASLTTNTAVDFVRGLEQDYLQQFPEKSDYESTAKMFYVAQCLTQGKDPIHKEQPNDPFNFAAYDLAEECLLSTYVILSSLQNVISPGSLPLYKPGHLGHRDSRRSWSQKSPREKFQDDQLALFEAFPDLMVVTLITSRSPLAEDELIRGFRDMKPGKDIPLWLVFATQCFLDIQHVLVQDVSRAHDQLMSTARSISASIEGNMKFHESLRVENWPRSNDSHLTEIIRVIEEWGDIVAEKLKRVIFHIAQ